MKTHTVGDVLRVDDFDNLGNTNATLIRELVRATLQPEHRFLEIDLSHTDFIDSEGLGTLVCLQRDMAIRGGSARVLHVSPRLRELFRLMKLDRVLEIPAP
jgi:anti-anti-sigma factor